MQLTDLEIATSRVFGGSTFELPDTGMGAREALETVILDAMLDRQVVVSFSGGRDSSSVLAVATHVARKHGLPLPVAMTKRYPGVPEAQESEWQERVIAHLGLDDWVRVEIEPGELGLLGPTAISVLARHGLLWPPNAYLHEPLLERAPGTTLLTGFNGDRLLDGWRWRAVVPTWGRRPPTTADARAVALRFLPTPLWTARKTSVRDTNDWLTAEGRRRLAEASVEEIREPLTWGARQAWLAGRRETTLVTEALSTMGRPHDVTVRHPMMAPTVLAGLASDAGWRGFPDRTEALHHMLADLLPSDILGRTTKAFFNGAVIDGTPLPTTGSLHPPLVSLRRVTDLWQSRTSPFGTFASLQWLWLAGQSGDAQAGGPGLECV